MAKKSKKKESNKNSDKIVYKEKSNVLTYVLLVIGIIISVFLAEYFRNKKIDDVVLAQLKYFETTNVDYKVYYKENPFYSEEYIDKDKTYITQYVDKIKADFNYFNSYSTDINGEYTYYAQATLKVFEPGREEKVYWAPVYDLTEKETVDFNNESSYRISKSIDIDYQKYLDIYQDYKVKSALSSSAKLVVEFFIINDGEYPGLDSIKRETNISMEIPLSDASFNIKLGNSVKPEEQSITKLEDNQADHVLSYIITALCWIFALFLGIALVIVYRINRFKESDYSRTLKRILNTYDSIIVNVETLPKVSDLSVVNVTSFEELVDAQMEVRLPINFKEDKNKNIAKFVLVRNNLAWVYTLKDDSTSKE